MKTSKKITIFEGSDCTGKTTAAHVYASATGARYVHFNNLPQVTANLGRMYVEAMLPALLGYQDVVLDRCWLSELPYGTAFRGGQDRLGHASRRMLERLAMRCGAVVVHCAPPWEQVSATFKARQTEEYLENETQLKAVYELYHTHLYHTQPTELPVLTYDYTAGMFNYYAIDGARTKQHPLKYQSAGDWEALTVIIGESFASPKDCDAFYQWPFASFSKSGCSQWLTEQLTQHNVMEQDLLWLNADQDLSILYDLKPELVVALGKIAYKQLYKLKINAVLVSHPQHHKRFSTSKEYELFNYI